ncbi:MAG: putative Fe-S oxidoreductase [Parcubacteria group bacterium Gr01-1014_56]|nr:MAG: putative Fe-S oxidoreductase [Parcubacteria group bacterium Gr01-1014_56]
MRMFSNSLYTLFLPLLLVISLPFTAIAQTGSADPTVEPSALMPQEATTTSAAAPTIPASRATSSQTSLPNTSTPTSPTPAAIPASTNPAPTVTSTSTNPPPAVIPTNLILLVALAALAILPFGYLVVQSLKNKKVKEEKKDDSSCFNLKKLLDEKLKELTDLRGKLESKAKGKAREALREGVKDTSAGDLLALLEKAEKEYGRLKKLFEECTLELKSKPQSVCILLENAKGEILLQLRDDKPSIQHPNQWVMLGGQMEAGETPEEAIKREMQEEIEVELDNFKLIRTYNWAENVEYVFHAVLDIDSKQTPLHEGQEIRYFPKNQVTFMQLAFHDNEIVCDYIGKGYEKKSTNSV